MRITNLSLPFVLWALLYLGSPVLLKARTWTDATTRRTIEGDLVETDGAKVVIKLNTGKTVRVALARLIAADRKYIKAQQPESAAKKSQEDVEEAGSSAGPLTRLTPPVSVKSHPIQGEGKKRKAGLEVTNNSEKSISKIVVAMYFVKKDGSTGRSVPHTESWVLGNLKGAFPRGESKLIKVGSFFMEDNTASVDGIVSHVEWKDGTTWPTWTGPTPKEEGNAPIVTKFIGVVGEGDRSQTAVAVFNVTSKAIDNVTYNMIYLDAAGKTLGRAMYGYSGADDWLPAGKGAGCTGCSSPPPEGTVDVKVTLRQVIFEDETVWTPQK